MKTTIIIKGGVSGNRVLANAIPCDDMRELSYGNKELTFNTKKEAVKALSVGYQTLREDLHDWNSTPANSYCRGAGLSYDASKAYIIQ